MEKMNITACEYNNISFKLDGATYTVACKTFFGGVGRNIAEGINKLFGGVHFISAVGNDEVGRNLKSHFPFDSQKRITTKFEQTTSTCTVIFDRIGECKLILGDMKIHQSITPELVIANESIIAKSPLVIMDSNIPLDTMGTVLEISKKYNRPVFFEPTDMRIAGKPFQLPRQLTEQIKFISPNMFELKEIAQTLNSNYDYNQIHVNFQQEKNEILKIAKILLDEVRSNFDCIVLTLGEHGAIIGRKSPPTAQRSNLHFFKNFEYILPALKGSWTNHFYSISKVQNLINVSGAGDSFTSGFITAMLKGKTESECVNFGFHAAICALKSEGAVPKEYFKTNTEYNECLQKEATFIEI